MNLLNIRLNNIIPISIWFTATVVAYYQHFGQSAVRHPAGGATLQKLCMSAGNAQATTRQTKRGFSCLIRQSDSALIVRTAFMQQVASHQQAEAAGDVDLTCGKTDHAEFSWLLISSIWSGCSRNTLLVTFGGSKVQGSVAVGVLYITVAGGGSYQGLNSLGMPIGRSIVQRCGPILSLHVTNAGLQMCDKFTLRNKLGWCPNPDMSSQDTARFHANAVRSSGS